MGKNSANLVTLQWPFQRKQQNEGKTVLCEDCGKVNNEAIVP
jgi:hypothetical protein